MQDADLLVKLYDLPEFHQPDEMFARSGIRIFRAMALDKDKIAAWISEHFGTGWTNEFEKAMANTPISCFVAVNGRKEIVGFSCYDATCRDFFGPVGVSKEYRGLHIGKELVLRALYAMREAGYGYAVIGWVEPKNVPFYQNACGAQIIPDSHPGVYRDSLLKL